MPAPLSLFQGVPFQITVQGTIVMQQTPKLVNRWAPTRVGTIAKSITGVPALQEIDRAWLPCALIFGTNERPPALMSDLIIKSFIDAMNVGGAKTLVLEGVAKQVMFDWSNGFPLSYNEVQPTGEFEMVAIPPGPNTFATQRLYEGSIRFLILL